MDNVILRNYRRIVLPLLWIFLTLGFSCSTLKSVEQHNQMSNVQMLKIGINEQDYDVFMYKMRELRIMPTEVQKRANDSANLLWLSFQFTLENDFITSRSAILATGLVVQIN